jgi:hypothetical protein
MKIKYKIFEVDVNHLESYKGLHSTQDRICLLSARLKGWTSNYHNSIEEAAKTIEENGNKYVEYLIIPTIYLTDAND